MNFSRTLRLFVGVLFSFTFGSILHAASDRIFTVRGVIKAPFANGTISIQHEAIPGFMPAMTMPFNTDAAEAKDLVAGDRVQFQFHVGKESRASDFEKIGRVTPEANEVRPSASGGAAIRRLREGDVVPGFSLIDQAGHELTQADLRGRHTILTFVFTRCPVPEFCPRIGEKFQGLQRELAAASTGPAAGPRVQLLSITIDPEHDRPPVLREYGEALGANFERWRFATGTAQEVARLTALFAVRTERNSGTLDHTLATALVGPDGKVIEIWRGNAWKPAEVLAKVAPDKS